MSVDEVVHSLQEQRTAEFKKIQKNPTTTTNLHTLRGALAGDEQHMVIDTRRAARWPTASDEAVLFIEEV